MNAANRLAITELTVKNKNFISYIALDDKRDFIDFELYPKDGALLNSIYVARVERVVANINAVFVKISETQTCYLPLDEIPAAVFTKKQSPKKAVCEGDELLAQVIKDAVKTKDAVASCRFTLNGTYSVLTTSNTGLNVSKKLPEELRANLKELLAACCSDHKEKHYGIVLRTNSANAGAKELEADVRKLVRQYETLLEKSKFLSAYTVVYKPYPEYIRRLQTIRSFSGASDGFYDGIYTDIPAVKEEIEDCLPYLAQRGLVHLYEDRQVSLKTLYHMEGNIEKLLSSKVWLSSGANIIIEQLETLTVIDVNSAKSVKSGKKKTPEELVLSVNKEAAREAARQLRLRNISGMILIDFINMEKPESMSELTAFLCAELRQDVVPCQFIDVTALGLVELTRKKINKSLKEMIDAG